MFLARMVSEVILNASTSQLSKRAAKQQQQQMQTQRQAKSAKKNKKMGKRKIATSNVLLKQTIEIGNISAKKLCIESVSCKKSAAKENSQNPSKAKCCSSNQGKKSKSQRRYARSWLKFPQGPERSPSVKDAHEEDPSEKGVPGRDAGVAAESTSVCRPGTLYSDVVFGAGSSCVVKIKTLTPRSNVVGEKKFVKSPIMLNRKGKENRDLPANPNLFPTITECVKPLQGSTTTKSYSSSITIPTPESQPTEHSIEPKMANQEEQMAGAVVAPTESKLYATEAVMETNMPDLGSSISDANYILPQCSYFTDRITPIQNIAEKLGIPLWNYLDIESNVDLFPRFLFHFEDAHYLEAEQRALVGLKLALGNWNRQQGRFKF